ncbi:site-specific DNA-methyltransferase [Aliarcobacter butzleri]|uniref:site-specific DNA-methyltransferase (adenine-specific) n=1 Tax=Aliarcobacter butzleri TaxID=28197 RepID=A0AAW7PUD8_9BACT|nr:site-specific DNA-methyltransferase [Aliarcobacter butzleri]MCT7538207.1 site-specific DNA-methyltransferase [Aliarcobacter butzleri]MCT7624905.1 site-specific DNA-methyltransferase [Aliarcobacter butzleri]MDN5064832.1 site-specific DNA-methyltransferase [Aliarcobacter butzleri]MDN5066734.1 site-specific DNA-methyltransferase [Aliarcobacter butzleri]
MLENKQHIERLFKNSEKFSDKDGLLFLSKILEAIEKIDIELIKILKNDERAKKHFFTQIDDIYILDQNKLIEFFTLNDYMKNGSFTAYSNKIGLIRKDNFIKKFDDVVLAFPHKDCVLEGGQTKEDDKKKEVFYNEILSSDEIDRLFEPKVLTNIKRYSKNGVEENCEIKNDDNLIIKGNNLIALHSLKKKFARKVKLIYIDPPYNTGNDSFKYNDNFNHSTWLTFMKNRLEVAREFLSEDGTISISIDNNELNYIQILLDEIFGIDNKKNLITIKRSSVSGAKVINNGVVNVSEFIVVYSNNTNLWKPNKVFRAKERDDRYNKFIKNKNESYEKWEYITILEAFSKFKSIKKSQLKKELGEYYSIEFEQFIFDNSQNICRFAALDDKAISKEVKEIKYVSKGDLSKTYKIEREKFTDYYLYNGEALLFFEDRLIELDGVKVFGELVTDIWDDVLPNDLHNEGDISFKKGKKPEKMIERLINLFSNSNDLIMDFHLGSGTTCAVAHKMGRRYIGIEQMDYIEDISVQRLKKVIDGEQGGISKALNWEGGGEFVYAELKQIDTFKNVEIGALNKNMQYLPISEMEDETYNIGKEEIAINKAFYGIENE